EWSMRQFLATNDSDTLKTKLLCGKCSGSNMIGICTAKTQNMPITLFLCFQKIVFQFKKLVPGNLWMNQIQTTYGQRNIFNKNLLIGNMLGNLCEHKN